MREIMYDQPCTQRLKDVKDTNIIALLSPDVVRKQRSLTGPVNLSKCTSVPNFPPISRTKSDSKTGHFRKSLNDMPGEGDTIRQLYLQHKPRPPRPGTPTFNSPFFRRRSQTHNALEKRVYSEPAMDVSLEKEKTRGQSGQHGQRYIVRPGSRSSLSRPKLRSTISCSSTHESNSNTSNENIFELTQSKTGILDRRRCHSMGRVMPQECSTEFAKDTSLTQECVIESNDLIMDKITDLPTKDLVDKCQKWLEGVTEAEIPSY